MTDDTFLPADFIDVPSFERLYQINSIGEVISLPKQLKWGNNQFMSKRRKLKHSISKVGYITVALTKDGVTKHCYLHRLLAKTFIKNPHNYKCINHKDGNKLNNNLNNIEWCTYQMNALHAFKTGLRRGIKYFGLNNPFGKFDDEIIKKIKKLKGKKTLKKTADEFNMSITHVWAIQNDKTRIGGDKYAK